MTDPFLLECVYFIEFLTSATAMCQNPLLDLSDLTEKPIVKILECPEKE